MSTASDSKVLELDYLMKLMKVCMGWKESCKEREEGLWVNPETALPVFKREMGYPITQQAFMGWALATTIDSLGQSEECWIFSAMHILHHYIKYDAEGHPSE